MSGGWYIDRDYIQGYVTDTLTLASAAGTHSRGWKPEMKKDPETVRFRLLDDDGEVYFGGYLLESEDGESAGWALLSWAMADAGAVRLDVREGPSEPWEPYM